MAATETVTGSARAPASTSVNKESMKSTWRKDPTQWTIFHRLYDVLNIHQEYLEPSKTPPVFKKTDKVPHVPTWSLFRHVAINASAPLILHQLYCFYTGKNLGRLACFGLYLLFFQLNGIRLLNQIRQLGQQFGYLDGDKHPRDGVPDRSVRQVFMSLINTALWRSVLILMLAYDPKQQPIQMNWMWLPLEQGLYGIILDFWFYWYHRIMHESDYFWKFHRTHHLTKHPNALLTLYADFVQEIFDIAGIPLFTWGTMKLLGLPMGFYEWWICVQSVVLSELSGHSGLRAHATTPHTLLWLLQWLECDLIIEDHDLHHRRGYKKSGNYGKATRLWDRIFGTLLPRVECTPDNIDYENAVVHPTF